MWSTAGVVVTFLFLQPHQSPCRAATIVEPSYHEVTSDRRPAITWSAVPNVTRYRVELESRNPEGRVFASIDTQVSSPLFRPAQPLTDARAAVKVRITAGCPADDGSQLRAQPASFFIDTAPLCPGPARIDVSENARGIQWAPTPNATRYDVTLLRPDGAPVTKGQTSRPEFALPAGVEPVVAVVRPYCATGFGPYTSALISASTR
jgi:hypothetical protein